MCSHGVNYWSWTINSGPWILFLLSPVRNKNDFPRRSQPLFCKLHKSQQHLTEVYLLLFPDGTQVKLHSWTIIWAEGKRRTVIFVMRLLALRSSTVRCPLNAIRFCSSKNDDNKGNEGSKHYIFVMKTRFFLITICSDNLMNQYNAICRRISQTRTYDYSKR